METLMENAIHEVFPDMTVEYDADFYQAVDMLEGQLQECTSMIKGVFDEYGTGIGNLSEDAMDEEDYFSPVFFTREAVLILPTRCSCRPIRM